MKETDEKVQIKRRLDEEFESMYHQDVECRQHKYDDIKRKFMEENLKTKPERKKLRILPKIAMVAGFVIAVFVTSLVFSEMPQIQAFHMNINEKISSLFEKPQNKTTYINFNELAKSEDIVLPTFTYIPSGFDMGEVDFSKGEDGFSINATLISESEYVSIGIENMATPDATSETFSFHDFVRIDKDNKIIAISENPPYSAVVFQELFEMHLSSNIPREELLKIVDGIL